MAQFRSVLSLAGGNVSPTLLIARALESRGHLVRILGHAEVATEIERAGLEASRFEAFERARPWNPRVADPGVRSMLAWLPLASDRGIGRDLEAAVARERPDVLLVDCMVPATGTLPFTRDGCRRRWCSRPTPNSTRPVRGASRATASRRSDRSSRRPLGRARRTVTGMCS